MSNNIKVKNSEYNSDITGERPEFCCVKIMIQVPIDECSNMKQKLE